MSLAMFLCFTFCLNYLVFFTVYKRNKAKIERKNKMFEAANSISSQLREKMEAGDMFASLFDFNHLVTTFLCNGTVSLEYKYSFLSEKFHYNHKLVFTGDMGAFWEMYNLEKQRFEADKLYRLYKIFMNNLTDCGNIVELDDKVFLIISKYPSVHCDPITLSTAPMLSPFVAFVANSSPGVGMGGENVMEGALKCKGFEKIRVIWENKIEGYDIVKFIIQKDEVDDFCNICEVMCAEELKW